MEGRENNVATLEIQTSPPHHKASNNQMQLDSEVPKTPVPSFFYILTAGANGDCDGHSGLRFAVTKRFRGWMSWNLG